MGRWLEHSVTTEIQAPVDRVWAVWSDLEAMPRWMRWIESVVTQPDDPDLTEAFSQPGAFMRPDIKELLDGVLYPWLLSRTRQEITDAGQAVGWPVTPVHVGTST